MQIYAFDTKRPKADRPPVALGWIAYKENSSSSSSVETVEKPLKVRICVLFGACFLLKIC